MRVADPDVRVAEVAPAPDAEAVLAAVGGGRRRWIGRAIRWTLLAAALAGAGIGGKAWLDRPAPQPTYETAAVERGDIDETVQATGTLQAKRVVSVGGEISGRIATVEVEVNQRVTKGQVLVTLDPASLDNALTEAKGALASAKINVERATAALTAAKITKERAETLSARGLAPIEELDTARSAYELAKADEARAKSERALAAVRVEQAKTNRSKATIVSPIDGVVLTRTIEPGNAISASLAAPELFRIAEDLSVMRLDLGVDEADVGRVREGQKATFTVDAWPGRTFEATVERVDLAPVTSTTTTTVVTYTAVLAVANVEDRLRPGMTATATILVEKHADVMRVPTAALRFDPNRAARSTGAETKSTNPLQPQMPRGRFGGGRRGGNTKKADAVRPSVAGDSAVYVLRDGEPERVEIVAGASDGRWTEVKEGTLTPDDEVIVSMEIGK